VATVGSSERTGTHVSGRSTNQTSSRCSPLTDTTAWPHSIVGFRCPGGRVTDILIDVHRAARAALKEAHPKLAVGWGVSVQDCQAEPGAEHVLKDYRHPRDEVFLEAARGDDWVGVQTYARSGRPSAMVAP
jgi:hypothetical protein